MKKFISGLLVSAVLLGGLSVSGQEVQSFSDVSTSFWAYDSIMTMTEKGYFAGKGNIVNGIGEFKPEDKMTRAEFITVVARILYGENNIDKQNAANWWEPYYNAMLNNNVITEKDIDKSSINEPMSRQEMALVAVKTTIHMGEFIGTISPDFMKYNIPDILTVREQYKNYVLMAYNMGILVGVDSKGNFAPNENLTRAQATMVLYRIVDKSKREKPQPPEAVNPVAGMPSDWPAEWTALGFTDPTAYYAVRTPSQGPITIKEGEVGRRPFAKEGDTVIKADGTQVVLKKGPNGILGEGQGVAPDLGVVVYTDGYEFTVTNRSEGPNFTGGTPHLDSTGITVQNSSYYVNKITGEGHWGAEWGKITHKPYDKGTFNYQLSEDKNWVWLESANDWAEISVQSIKPEGIELIKSLNGM